RYEPHGPRGWCGARGARAPSGVRAHLQLLAVAATGLSVMNPALQAHREPDEGGRAYLALLKKTLIRFPMSSADVALPNRVRPVPAAQLRAIDDWIARSLAGAEPPPDVQARARGQDWPETGESMIGLDRLDNLETCLLDVIANGIDGDVAET